MRNLISSGRNIAVSFQHLRYAVAAADHGSFRSAAETLMIQQTTLSRCIHQLEHAIGTAIFDRYSGGVRATKFGQSFLRLARSILEQVDSIVTSAQMTGRGELGRISIGFYTSLSAGNLRAVLVEYTQQFPQIEIEMIERSRNRLTTALRNRAIDAAIVTGERALLGSKSMPLWSERILVVLPENHRLTENQTVSWTDLAGEVLLLGRRDPGPVIQECLNAKLVSPEDRPRIVWHDVSRESIKSLVAAHLGIGLTLEASLGTNSDGVVHREIRDGGGPARIGLSINWLEDNENPALANFLNLLKRRYPSSF
ncbi:LysR family transcriptional regulator [Bradyrhizobium centrolobii]|uniref:LysR family transcriptional regulator n=1 Tax=Bradyrhizobium centrolobii TaxID=1505087 RepID=A0A176YZV0_9BRAD|nr:LysR family transcriptional regulator [Bradyrhizobium centrolobii]OAF12306.1 LysR family transcriptional regulator [Bradyrhizobium centrolobii]